jgi:hypothetical protein
MIENIPLDFLINQYLIFFKKWNNNIDESK